MRFGIRSLLLFHNKVEMEMQDKRRQADQLGAEIQALERKREALAAQCGDRLCPSCRERMPLRAKLCARCGHVLPAFAAAVAQFDRQTGVRREAGGGHDLDGSVETSGIGSASPVAD